MKRKFIKFLTAGVSCFLVLSMLTGCLVEKEKEDNGLMATPQPQPDYLIAQIELSGYRSSNRSTNLEDFIQEFNSTYPSVDVTVLRDYVSAEQYFSQLDSHVETGTAGSVFLCDNERMAKYAAEGKIIPLDKYLTNLLNFDTFKKIDPATDVLPAAYEASKYGGRLYMAPIEYYHKFIFLNYDLLSKAGFDFPADDWNWDDLIAMAEAIKAGGTDTPIVMDYHDYAIWGAFARSYGQDIYESVGNSDYQALNMTHPAVVQGLNDLANLVDPSRGLVKCADASELSVEELINYAFIVVDHEDISVWSEFLSDEDCPFEWDYIHFPRWHSQTAANAEKEPEEEEPAEPTEVPEVPEETEGDETEAPADATEGPSGNTSPENTPSLPADYYQSIGATVYGFAVYNFGESEIYNDEYYRSCAYLALYAMVDAAAKAYVGRGETVPAHRSVLAVKSWREFPVEGKNASVFSHFAETADFADNLTSFMPIVSASELDVGAAIDAYLNKEATMVELLQQLQDYANASWIEP